MGVNRKMNKMTRTGLLLEQLSEEASEVIQRVSKIQRFGLHEIQPGQDLTNAQRLEYELNDLYAVADLLSKENDVISQSVDEDAITAKQKKVEKYLDYSRELGILVDEV